MGLKIFAGGCDSQDFPRDRKKIMKSSVSEKREESEKMEKKVNDLSQVVVSAGVLSEIIGVTDRRIRTLAEEGILIKVSSGRYKLMESLHGYILNLKVMNNAKEQASYDGEVDYEEEKALHERIKRQQAELKLSLMNGEVHKSDDVKTVMEDMLSNLKSKLSSIPSKLAPRVEHKDKSEILVELTEEIEECLQELSEYNPSDFYGKEYIWVGDDNNE